MVDGKSGGWDLALWDRKLGEESSTIESQVNGENQAMKHCSHL